MDQVLVDRRLADLLERTVDLPEVLGVEQAAIGPLDPDELVIAVARAAELEEAIARGQRGRERDLRGTGRRIADRLESAEADGIDVAVALVERVGEVVGAGDGVDEE